MLFSTDSRNDHTPKLATETEFAFLDRCAWPAASRVREFLETCLSHYPADERTELISRIRSGDPRHFASGTFELILHEYLFRLDFALVPHPELPNGSPKRPDFRVTCHDGQQLYLEAVSASDDDGRDLAAEARKAIALQSLDSAQHADFMVAIDTRGDPATQPRGKRLAEEVLRWLDSLDPDTILAESAKGFEALPEYVWQHEDWQVRVRPIAVNPESRGLPRRLIGTRNFGAGWIDGWTPIRDAVLYKSRRYGELDLPLVVAVNVDSFSLHRIDEAQALFGQEQYIFTAGAEQEGPRFERKPNGAWRGPGGPRGKRCSGAWLFNNVSPYSVAQRNHTLYVNPWAARATPESFLRMPHAQVDGERIQHKPGLSFRDVLGLEENWPE